MKTRISGIRPGGGNELDFGMLFLDRLCEFCVAVNVLLSPLFIADAHHFQVERSGMSERRALRAPSGVRRAVGKFNQVQRVLNVRPKFVERTKFAGVELAGHAAVDDGQRFGADVLAQLEKLKEAEAERLVVIRRRTMNKFIVPAVDEE